MIYQHLFILCSFIFRQLINYASISVSLTENARDDARVTDKSDFPSMGVCTRVVEWLGFSLSINRGTIHVLNAH